MSRKLHNGLEKLREFLHGAHMATNDENASGVLHQACHKIDDILKEMAAFPPYDALYGCVPHKEADYNVGGK